MKAGTNVTTIYIAQGYTLRERQCRDPQVFEKQKGPFYARQTIRSMRESLRMVHYAILLFILFNLNLPPRNPGRACVYMVVPTPHFIHMGKGPEFSGRPRDSRPNCLIRASLS